MQIRLLEREKEFEQALGLFEEIEPLLTTENGLQVLKERLGSGSFLFGLLEGESVISAAFANEILMLNGKRVLWVCYLATREDRRSQGLGGEVMKFIEQFARENAFYQTRVHSSYSRLQAHHFYTDHLGFEDWARLFVKNV